ncbi:FkbM family methyltransferase [Pedobacter sp. Du54]|uniref:FkbM family methyltransferase n=1 Tax=Pedobacter anseongensis TaxID=3133439 RepID=UPI0030A901D4
MITRSFRFVLKRKLFKGQFRLFSWLLKHNLLLKIKTIGKPVIGNFKLHLNTKNFIESCIYYTGDYESYLKMHYKKLINPGDIILDIGANIGFHSLYFAELTGQNGKVFSFEPIQGNFDALKENLALNNFPQIFPSNIALGNENARISIYLDQDAKNPGAYSLLAKGEKNYVIACEKGDDFLKKLGVDHVHFMKIDVEGYEFEVLKGLENTINKSRPIINFEYDRGYQLKNIDDPNAIFTFLAKKNYQFFSIDGYSCKTPFIYNDSIQGAEIIAEPIN